ncbi:MAG: hypothetical protein K6G94_01495 [Kiritimatiellae bacterium]|nr:hypothetical protein [Kiritimatiellia bacterium]
MNNFKRRPQAICRRRGFFVLDFKKSAGLEVPEADFFVFNCENFAFLHLGRGSAARRAAEIGDAPGLVDDAGGDESEVHAGAACRARDELERREALWTIVGHT